MPLSPTQEALVGALIAAALGVVSAVRVQLFSDAAGLISVLAIAVSLMLVVVFSVVIGAALPFFYGHLGLDPCDSFSSGTTKRP